MNNCFPFLILTKMLIARTNKKRLFKIKLLENSDENNRWNYSNNDNVFL